MTDKMKKFVWILCAVLALGACKKDNSTDSEGDEGFVEVEKLSDLEHIQETLVTVDDDGNITGYNVGDNLNEADPSEVSVPVDSYEEARNLFLKWLPDNAKPSVNGKTYTWELTDEEYKSEGQAVFAESSAPGVIATLSIIALDLKVRTVKFIPTSAWPENSSDMEEYLEENYYLGAEIEVKENEGAGTGTYVVIREWTKQENGIMIRMESKEYDLCNDGHDRKNCSSINTTQTVSRVLHEGSNYEYFVNDYGKRHNWHSLGKRYMTSKKKTNWYGSTDYYFVRLDSGKADTFDDGLFDCPGYRKVYIYWFKPDGNKIEIW